jgi:hypothetical protein
MISGNGIDVTSSATNATTAIATWTGPSSARLATRTTAWATIATTAGATPRNTAVTAVVSP